MSNMFRNTTIECLSNAAGDTCECVGITTQRYS